MPVHIMAWRIALSLTGGIFPVDCWAGCGRLVWGDSDYCGPGRCIGTEQ